MYRFQLKIILHTKNQEVAKLMKRTIIRCQNRDNRRELSDEDYKMAMIKMIQQIIISCLKQKESLNKEIQEMMTKWRVQNWKIQ